MSNKCTICEKELTGQQKLFCSQACHRVKRNEKSLAAYYESKAQKPIIYCEVCSIELYGRQTRFCSKDCLEEFYKEKKKAEFALKKIPKRKKCEICGKHFENNRSDTKRFCSKRCRNLKSQELYKQKKEKKPRIEKNCEICKRLFIADSRAGTRQKYCGKTCANVAIKKLHENYKGRYSHNIYCRMCKVKLSNGNRTYCEDCIDIRKAEKQEFAAYKRVCTDCKKPTNNHRCDKCLAAHRLKHGVVE